jgi:DNA-binding MarR family transcriptional regulator
MAWTIDVGTLESRASERAAPVLMVPMSIAADTTLSPGAKLVFAAVFTAADQDPKQRCRLANRDLESQTALSGKQVKRLLVELEAMGLIARDFGGLDRRSIVVTWTTARPVDAPSDGYGTASNDA